MSPGPTHKLKTIKKEQWTQTDQPQTPHRNPEHIIFRILNTICGENRDSLWVQVSLSQEIYKYYLVTVDHNSMVAQLTRNDCEEF